MGVENVTPLSVLRFDKMSTWPPSSAQEYLEVTMVLRRTMLDLSAIPKRGREEEGREGQVWNDKHTYFLASIKPSTTSVSGIFNNDGIFSARVVKRWRKGWYWYVRDKYYILFFCQESLQLLNYLVACVVVIPRAPQIGKSFDCGQATRLDGLRRTWYKERCYNHNI